MDTASCCSYRAEHSCLKLSQPHGFHILPTALNSSSPNPNEPRSFAAPKHVPARARHSTGTASSAQAFSVWFLQLQGCRFLAQGHPSYLLLAVKLAARSTVASFFLMPAGGSAARELEGPGKARG